MLKICQVTQISDFGQNNNCLPAMLGSFFSTALKINFIDPKYSFTRKITFMY